MNFHQLTKNHWQMLKRKQSKTALPSKPLRPRLASSEKPLSGRKLSILKLPNGQTKIHRYDKTRLLNFDPTQLEELSNTDTNEHESISNKLLSHFEKEKIKSIEQQSFQPETQCEFNKYMNTTKEKIINELIETNKNICSEISQYQQLVQTLQKQLKNAAKYMQSLDIKHSKSYETLAVKYEKLKTENNQLKIENTTLKTQNKMQEQENMRLKNMKMNIRKSLARIDFNDDKDSDKDNMKNNKSKPSKQNNIHKDNSNGRASNSSILSDLSIVEQKCSENTLNYINIGFNVINDNLKQHLNHKLKEMDIFKVLKLDICTVTGCFSEYDCDEEIYNVFENLEDEQDEYGRVDIEDIVNAIIENSNLKQQIMNELELNASVNYVVTDLDDMEQLILSSCKEESRPLAPTHTNTDTIQKLY